jgi:hypothetical protein
MTRKNTGYRPPQTSLDGRVCDIAGHSATLAARLRERAESAVRGTFGEPPFHSFEEAVLGYGRPFAEALIPAARQQGPMKRCYRNALTAAFGSRGRATVLTYCEGFAMPVSLGIVVEHAWLVDPQGRVIDPTWDDADDCGYVGVPLTLQHMAKSQRRGFYGHLWVTYAQLFEHGLPEGALA